MILNLLVVLCFVFILSTAERDILNFTDAETCKDLCKSCNGIATFKDGQCECNIEQSINEGAECVLRMKREASEHGLDFVSCDLSSDKRFTRCLLGTKHEFVGNDIDQVAKYFMEDGPMTGSIFQAPPYTHTNPPDTIQNANNDCSEQPSLFVLNPLQESTPSPRISQHVSNSRPQHTASSPQTQQLLSSIQQQYNLNSPHSQHFVSSPQSSHLASNLQSRHFTSSQPKDYVGAPKIITQPKETMVAPSPVVNYIPTPIDNCVSALGKAVPSSNSPIVGDINPNLLREETNTPNFFQILGEQLSRPMFGIPQAIQTVSQTPGISNLVNAPANLLYTFLQRLNEHSANEVSSTQKGNELQNVKASASKVTLTNPIVGAQVSPFNYNYPTIGSQMIGVLNPAVGVPASAQVSYIQQMPAAMPMIHGPILGNISPYNGFVPQVPTAYVVGAPIGLPYYTNCNTAAFPAPTIGTITQMDDSPKTFVDQNVGTSNDKNVGLSFFNPFKKLCKKSAKEETSVKTTRDIKNTFKSTNEKVKIQEIKKQLKDETISKQLEQTLSEIPKIHRATTQRSILEKVTDQKVNVEKYKTDKLNIEKSYLEKQMKNKVKPQKEIIKYSAGEKQGTR